MMTPQDREAAQAQAERQSAIGKRTDDVAGEAARKLGGMPGMEKAESELKGASSRMRQAGENLRRDDSKGAAAAERDAADRLAKLRDSMQDRQMGSRPAARSGPHPGRRRIDRAARLAPGAARRDEGEGARALPRRGPPLLRGAGAMTGARGARLASPSLASPLASPPRAPRRRRAPTSLGGAPRTRSTGCWTPGVSAKRTPRSTALRKTAPNAPEVAYLDGYNSFMRGDYDGAARALATAAQTAERQPRRQAAGRSGQGGARRRSRITRRSAPPTSSSATRPRTPCWCRTRATRWRRRTRRCTTTWASTPSSRSASSSIAARPISRPYRRCRRRRSRAPARSRSASGRA